MKQVFPMFTKPKVPGTTVSLRSNLPFLYDDEEAANTEFEVDAYDPSALPELLELILEK